MIGCVDQRSAACPYEIALPGTLGESEYEVRGKRRDEWSKVKRQWSAEIRKLQNDAKSTSSSAFTLGREKDQMREMMDTAHGNLTQGQQPATSTP